jgi:hypothetical protein
LPPGKGAGTLRTGFRHLNGGLKFFAMNTISPTSLEYYLAIYT